MYSCMCVCVCVYWCVYPPVGRGRGKEQTILIFHDDPKGVDGLYRINIVSVSVVCLSVWLAVCLSVSVSFFHESGWPAGVMSVHFTALAPPCRVHAYARRADITPVNRSRHSVAPGLMPAGVRVLPPQGGALCPPRAPKANARFGRSGWIFCCGCVNTPEGGSSDMLLTFSHACVN